ncbi:MAG TPA: hypothetical protein VGD39_18450 [Nocardioides sp.]
MSAVLQVVRAASAWPERTAPEPAGAAGLALALLVVLVLTVHLFRSDWRDKVAPGPVPARRPARETEWRALHWVSSTVLLVALVAVVVERVVVLA